jgi:hypothetical protein
MQACLLASVLAAATGCETVHNYSFTAKLWETHDFLKWSEPAPGPNLALYQSENHRDILVLYDAWSEKHSVVKRQAYYARSSRTQVAAGKRPVLLDPRLPARASPIPILQSIEPGTNPPPSLPLFAFVTKQGREFTLCQPGLQDETFELPVYLENSGTAARLGLTPFAVVGDTVLVGLAASVVGFLIWAGIGCPGINAM